MSSPARSAEILLVEDDPNDVRLTLEAMREGHFRNRVTVVRDGEAALLFLTRQGAYADAPRPDLILLDLNLPKKDGREVLAVIKSDLALRRIPVVVLTTSRAEEDIGTSYDLHANCFITKPGDFEEFIAVVRHIEEFWLAVATLPSAAEAGRRGAPESAVPR